MDPIHYSVYCNSVALRPQENTDTVYGTPNSHFTHAQDVEKEKNNNLNNLNNSQRNTCITIGTINLEKERRINLNVLTHNIVIFYTL